MMIKFGNCTKPGCDNQSFRNFGDGSYCVKHYRFSYMRKSAKDCGKYVPSYEELEQCLSNLSGMRCRGCDKTMIWHTSLGDRPDVLSLQHNRDGSIEFICCSCNASHCKIPGDLFFDITDNLKFCQRCKVVKDKSQFHKSSLMKTGVSTLCISCESIRHKEKRAKMSEEDHERQRNYQRAWLKQNPDKLKRYRKTAYENLRRKRQETICL